MKLIWAKIAFVVLTLGLVGGCATDLRISGVTISVTEIRPSEGSSSAALVTLRYVNESVVPIAVSESSHKLYLNGSYVGKAVSKEAVGMPQLNMATQTITFQIENPAVLQQQKAGSIPYRIESVLHVEAGEQYDNVKLKSSGSIDASAVGPKS